ncbi:unnamed protein product [Rotaria sp. Silwood2]|nr:unnamed protein product [Rotaria sp. Silwood2]CAF4280336.1 unnamed protein product [Rotaria sp. Silwood2]
MHSYSSGIHCIRLRLDNGFAFLGIRSRNIPPVPLDIAGGRYDLSPSTYGWSTTGHRVSNGRDRVSGPARKQKDNEVLALTLNCDEHQLSIVNESGKYQDEMKEKAKLPKCRGNVCSRCGKCFDWYYDGDIDLDDERFSRGECYDICDENRWHRRPNGPSVTCCYFYNDHHGYLGNLNDFDICRCARFD